MSQAQLSASAMACSSLGQTDVAALCYATLQSIPSLGKATQLRIHAAID
jgi:hypothetical protein